MKTNYINLFFLIIILFFSACKKKQPTNINTSQAINNSNSFSEVYSQIIDTRGVGGFPGASGVTDFTIEGNILHAMFYGSSSTQQSNQTVWHRRSINLSNKQIIAQPVGADTVLLGGANLNSNYSEVYAAYLPYKNFYTRCYFNPYGFASVTTNVGDINFSTVMPTVKSPDLGYRFPCNNITNQVHTDNGTGSIGFSTFVPSYTFSQYSSSNVQFQNMSGFHTSVMIIEPHRKSAADSVYAISFREDSIVAYTMSASSNGVFNITKRIAAIKNFDNNPKINNERIIRHYSVDGDKLSVAILGEDKAYTFTFDFKNHAIAKGVETTSITFLDFKSNIDLDEEGNIYCSKTNSTGNYDIVKYGINGSTTTIASNVLKYGAIVRVKYLLGKIYFAASGVMQDDKSNVAIISQK
jgi:hypothetical protein